MLQKDSHHSMPATSQVVPRSARSSGRLSLGDLSIANLSSSFKKVSSKHPCREPSRLEVIQHVLEGLCKRWPGQSEGHPQMSTMENGPFSVIGVINGIPLHSEPLLHRSQAS